MIRETAGFEAVRYEPPHRDRLFALMRDVWGSYMDAAEFDWWYERNPVRPGTITLAVADGRVVGMLAMSYARMRLAGREALAAFAIDGATHPDFRGRGIFQTLELENERLAAEAGAEIAVGFTNPQAGPILVGRVGWSDIRRLRLWARPLRPLRLLRRRVESGDGLRPLRERLGIGLLDRFDAEAEALARAAVPGDHVIRDAAYLNWRYAESPRGYRRLGAFRGDRLTGFAVVGHRLYRGVSAAYVADLVAADAASAWKLLRASVAQARGGADAVVGVPLGAGAFAAAGFVPSPQTIRLIAKPLSGRARLPESGRAWNLTLGDSDIF